jgi:hypothetical protein
MIMLLSDPKDHCHDRIQLTTPIRPETRRKSVAVKSLGVNGLHSTAYFDPPRREEEREGGSPPNGALVAENPIRIFTRGLFPP